MGMQTEMHIDEVSGLVTITARGAVTYAGIIGALTAMLADARFQKGASILWDFRSAVSKPLTADDVKGIVSFLEKGRDVRGEDYKVAIVSQRDADFGMARMYEGYTGRLPFEVMVFRGLEDALKWIRG